MPIKPTVLLVEDNPNDAAFFKLAFNKVCPDVALHEVSDASWAMHYLHGTGPYQDREMFPLPYAVVADLTLPGISGGNLVKWIRLNPQFGKLLIVAWTGSQNPQDIALLYRLGANSFLNKTDVPEKLANDIRELHEFWRQMGMLVNFVPQIDYSQRHISPTTQPFFYRVEDWPDFTPPPPSTGQSPKI